MNERVRVEFELAYYEFVVQHFSYDITETVTICNRLNQNWSKLLDYEMM